MKKLLALLLVNLLAFTSFGQIITLKGTKTTDDLQLKNDTYTIYFKKSDIISAISAIDNVMKTNNATISSEIAANKLKLVDLKSTNPADKSFIALIKSNLGAYLLTREKATIFQGSKSITKIMIDESPRVVELDGSARTTILFFEEGHDDPIFLGDLNTKLK